MTIMLSCGGKGGQQRVASDEQDTSAVNVIPTDKTLYGICGEGTAMNTLQLLRDNGDTVMMSITNAIEAGQVFGGLMVGDRLAVMPNATGSEAVIVINQNTLLGDWVMPNPIDGSSEVGIRIKEGGVAESIDQSSIVYKSWRLFNGKLQIQATREDGIDMEEFQVFSIVKLTADSLVIADEEDTYEYSHPSKNEDEDLDIDLDEGYDDEFRI